MNKTYWSARTGVLLPLFWLAANVAFAQTFTSLHSFSGPDGSGPNGTVVQGVDGNMYGTTFYGGTNNAGTLYMVTPGGALTTLYSFCSLSNCADGANPQSTPILGSDGNIYGTTDYGGGSGSCYMGCGTIFRFSNGTLTTVYALNGFLEGNTPQGGLVQGVDGNFYGNTLLGGMDQGIGFGTIYTASPTGTFTTLYTFDYNNGETSYAPLLQYPLNSKLYGVTYGGGALGVGEVYEIGPAGMNVLYSFPDLPGGNHPIGGLTAAKNGLLYGVALGGPANSGTFYSITTSGTLTTLYSFDGTHGGKPFSLPGLALGMNGLFYGTATVGGPKNDGVVFSLNSEGVYHVLHEFAGTDGSDPVAGLAQATDGSFYSATPDGGTSNQGTVYNISVGLPAFVQPVPPFGAAGTTIIILGTNLTGTSSVTFNGVAAGFSVVSSSEITATIPAGATSGELVVVTPSSTLSSKLPFRVYE